MYGTLKSTKTYNLQTAEGSIFNELRDDIQCAGCNTQDFTDATISFEWEKVTDDWDVRVTITNGDLEVKGFYYPLKGLVKELDFDVDLANHMDDEEYKEFINNYRY
jgi:hypothetical protein